MTDTASLLENVAGDLKGGRQLLPALEAWMADDRKSLHIAGMLRGSAVVGNIVWAAGLAWIAQRALHSHGTTSAVASAAPGVVLIFIGLLLRAVLLALAEQRAEAGASAIRARLRARLIAAGLRDDGTTWSTNGVGLVHTVDHEVSRLTPWLVTFVPARFAMMVGSGLTLCAIAGRSWIVAIALVIATPLLPANLKVIGMGTQSAVRAQLQAARSLSAEVLDQLRGLPTIVGLGATDHASRVTEAADRRLAQRTQRVLRIAFLSTAWVELLITMTMAIVATYCGLALLGYLHLEVIPSTMSLGTALFVLVLTPVYFAPMREIARGYHARAEAAAAAELISAALDGEPTETTNVGHPSYALVHGCDAPIGLELIDVHLTYPGRAEASLQSVTCTVSAGELVAITGPSGAGKSTLLAVAAGLLRPDAGRASHVVDGTISTANPAHVAWVGQPTHLIPGTVRENLRLAAPVASDTEIAAALTELGFDGLLDTLPHGLDTAVVERGEGLSAGQIQQLVLARALLRNAPVVVLDEPTDHLDEQNLSRVVAAIKVLARSRTVLVATHSPQLEATADQVLALHGGVLVGPRS